MATKKTALIIGAGPAGLTAAHELLARTDIHPIICEADPTYVGGISRTVNYKGNRIDIGGHRFFSKSDRIMQWWANVLPIALPKGASTDVTYQRTTKALTQGLLTATDKNGEAVMHVRPRKTRIIYGGKFFAYPIELSLDTLLKLGPVKVVKIGVTYLQAVLFPIRPEKTLEDFFLNRFGRELYETFFKSYTEKVWGTTCDNMSAEWGAQRVKGLSIMKAVLHAAKKIARIGALSGKGVETSLIEQYLYPTYGPGQMWEEVVKDIKAKGGELRMNTRVVGLQQSGSRITHVTLESNGTKETIAVDYIFSSTDIKALVAMLPSAPKAVHSVAESLEYRDFLTVGLLLKEKIKEPDGSVLTDTWMYVHEKGVHVGRVQLFHNWHPKLAANPAHGWIGLEYFVNEGDHLWSMDDTALVKLGTDELEKIGLRRGIDVIDGTVIRQPKAYPGYFGGYEQFPVVRTYLDTIENLFPVGRNGMHRYNNQDHSMLSAMTAVDNIIEKRTDKSNLWAVNTEEEYHEEKK
ncbi:MAG: NAD(P)/FAD-dependent oxidoreductase [Candidatus Pacebacteria bacterium]|nr:NAD(P)/FAD-dependent oxidoreductase [Candidatus Paceibacterota bacterium]